MKLPGSFNKAGRSKRLEDLERHDQTEQYGAVRQSLRENEELLSRVFKECAEAVFHRFELQPGTYGLLIYFGVLVQRESLAELVLQPLMEEVRRNQNKGSELVKSLLSNQCESYPAKDLNEVVAGILSGYGAMFIDGQEEGLLFHFPERNRRGIEEPKGEASIRGPREGFVEDLRINLGLLRLKIKSPRLKTRRLVIGRETQTDVVLAYIEGIADSDVVEEAWRRLVAIRIDGVLESGYLEEFIQDNGYSPFPQLQNTERPDIVASELLEGRFAILVDGTPFVLMAPVTFWQFLQANEDYYERFLIGTLVRWLRFFFSFVALYLPALYVAVTTFHQDMLPTSLLLSVATAREDIPFPAMLEAFIMEIAFEALREAGVRLPKTVGQAVGILGALVIGQAAVEAGIVSAPMVIVVSLTGISSFAIPRYNMAISLRILRFPMIIAAGFYGLFGMIFATMLLYVHICQLRSFGVPYMSGLSPFSGTAIRDSLMRPPWWSMKVRPPYLSPDNRVRLQPGSRHETGQEEW